MGINENERSRNLSHLSLESIPRSINDSGTDQNNHLNELANETQLQIINRNGDRAIGEVNEKNGEP